MSLKATEKAELADLEEDADLYEICVCCHFRRVDALRLNICRSIEALMAKYGYGMGGDSGSEGSEEEESEDEGSGNESESKLAGSDGEEEEDEVQEPIKQAKHEVKPSVSSGSKKRGRSEDTVQPKPEPTTSTHDTRRVSPRANKGSGPRPYSPSNVLPVPAGWLKPDSDDGEDSGMPSPKVPRVTIASPVRSPKIATPKPSPIIEIKDESVPVKTEPVMTGAISSTMPELDTTSAFPRVPFDQRPYVIRLQQKKATLEAKIAELNDEAAAQPQQEPDKPKCHWDYLLAEMVRDCAVFLTPVLSYSCY